MILTTHYMDEADKLCDRIAIIDHGRSLRWILPRTLNTTLAATS
jgi:ABC-2 type transport system ATP-binding protein